MADNSSAIGWGWYQGIVDFFSNATGTAQTAAQVQALGADAARQIKQAGGTDSDVKAAIAQVESMAAKANAGNGLFGPPDSTPWALILVVVVILVLASVIISKAA